MSVSYINVIDQRGDFLSVLKNQASVTPSQELVVIHHPHCEQVEKLRNIRNHLALQWFSDERKSLVLISPNADEGRSFIAANLAVSFAQLGRNTLLIDADLRAPRQHEIFNVANERGLTSLLTKPMLHTARETVCHYMEHLSVLPAGPEAENPQELLGSTYFAGLLKELSARYDVILIDSPLAKVISDADVVSAAASGAMMVTRLGLTKIQDVILLSERVKMSGIPIVGSIINGA